MFLPCIYQLELKKLITWKHHLAQAKKCSQSVFSLAKGPERGSKIKTTPATLIIPTPAKYHIKNCGPILSPASKGLVGCLDFYLYQVMMKSPILPAVWCQRLSRQPILSSQPVVLRPRPLGSLDFYPT